MASHGGYEGSSVTGQAEAASGHRTVRDWLIAWFPAIITMSVMLGIIGSYVVTWPGAPTLPNGITVEGIVVTFDAEANTIQSGYPVGEGPSVYRVVAIGEGTADPGYRWNSLSAGSRIRVIYDSSDPQVSLPYRDFPVWTIGSWITVIGFATAVIAVWVRKRWLSKAEG